MAYATTVESFASLRAAWHDLLDRAPLNTVFFTPEWLETWWRFFGHGHELRVFGLYQDQELLGIAPLMQEGDELRLIGSQDVCDYLDFIPQAGREGAFFHLLLSRLEALPWRALKLHSVRSDSPTLALLPNVARGLGWSVTVEQEDVCPRVELPESWEQYQAGLDKKDRHELRRKLRRLAAQGDWSYHALTGESAGESLDDFLRLLSESREEKARFLTPDREAFFRAMAQDFLGSGVARLYFLELDNVRCASVLCFDYAGELSLYNSGYDPALAPLSVGLILKAMCLKDAIEEGKRRFDFLRGAEPYKYHLGGQDIPVYTLTIERAQGA